MTDEFADTVRLSVALKGARDNLTRAQTFLRDAGDREILQGAIDRIDIIGCDLPEWATKGGGLK